MRAVFGPLVLWATLALGGCGGEGDRPSPPAADAAGAMDSTPVDASLPDAARPPLPAVPEGCNPIAAEWDCLLPFPSDVFRVPDPQTVSGFRVEVPLSARPVHAFSGPINLQALHPADGFSTIQQIIVALPYEVAAGELVTLDGDYAGSARGEGRTVLLNALTGAFVEHIAEQDPRSEDREHAGLILRPLVRLEDQTRYIVALRSLHAADGSVVPTPLHFAALRDAQAGPEPSLAARYERDIFAPLELAQVSRADLLLAWDFTTRSFEDASRDLLEVRGLAAAALRETPPVVTIDTVRPDPKPEVAFLIEGKLRVPLFLEHDQLAGLIHRSPEGRIAQNGFAEVPFLAIVPRSVVDEPDPPARLVQFGHGFFGTRREIIDNHVFELAHELRWVVVCVDWWGMSGIDGADVVGRLADNGDLSMRFVDRVQQAMVNQMAVARAAKTTLPEVAAFRSEAGGAYFDPSAVYYYGISLGGILGGTYLAIAPDVDRGVLSVGGAGFSMLMHRARPFAPFLGIIESQVNSPLDALKFVSLSQLTLDRIDPMTFAHHLTSDPFEGSSADRRQLLQVGIGDAQVPNIGWQVLARTIGLNRLGPTLKPRWNVETVEGPIEGSALVEFDFGLEDPLPGTFAELPASGNDVHEGVRRLSAAHAQTDLFLRPGGRIEATCDGPCDPE